ncbi:MAG: hypothetical protein A3B17_00040 [Candidatus Yanofskybacteria bacterium RIFCSPLOWO2_01_FULL_45_72]|nr:MAG: hypothetical protein A3B17_00040 [Candidatus Yanofskybacteria bacterium RIFCSPLOWO2_01_FULL_45_72]
MVKRTGQNQITRKQREFVFREQKAFTPVDRNALYACEHILHQVDSIITGLKNFKEYRKYGAKLEGGMLIHGPKGTGKTTMAQLIATESGAHFVDLTLYPTPHPVWGPVDVAALFKNGDAWVKKHDCPLVYFIDQFDDVYEKQKKVMREFEIRLCGIRERCGGVFFILTSLKPPNGFDSDEKECTLFREGRIGAHLELSKPDFQQQVLLMQGFLSRWAHEENIDVRSLARFLNSQNPSVATIKSILETAWNNSVNAQCVRAAQGAEQKAPTISQEGLLEVLLGKVLPPPSGHTLSVEDEYHIALHEAGHAIVGRAYGFPVYVVSVNPSTSGTLGITLAGLDIPNYALEDLFHGLAASCGGFEAEQLLGFAPNTGKGGDLDKIDAAACEIIDYGYRNILGEYNLSEVTPDRCVRLVSSTLKQRYEYELADITEKGRFMARETLEFFGEEMVRKVAKAMLVNPRKMLLQKELDAVLDKEGRLTAFHNQKHIKDYSSS